MGANKRHNQDWFAVERLELARLGQSATLLCVADGHGAKQYSRSDLGARFAVAAFQRTATRFFADAPPGSWPALESKARDEFPQELVLQWRRSVVLHAANNPPRGASPRASDGEKVTVDETVRLYGSTLIGAVVAPGLFAAWQIGDGDLVIVETRAKTGETGEPYVRYPLPRSGPDIGDETDSLSLSPRDATQRIHVAWELNVQPALVSLSSDGLSKSFADQAGFKSFCAGLFNQLKRGEQQAVAESLPNWLARAAAHSGDDSTLCALYDPTAIRHGAAVASAS